MKKGMLIVTDLAIALLCAAGLFLTLLEDRFRPVSYTHLDVYKRQK